MIEKRASAPRYRTSGELFPERVCRGFERRHDGVLIPCAQKRSHSIELVKEPVDVSFLSPVRSEFAFQLLNVLMHEYGFPAADIDDFRMFRTVYLDPLLESGFF